MNVLHQRVIEGTNLQMTAFIYFINIMVKGGKTSGVHRQNTAAVLCGVLVFDFVMHSVRF